MPWLNWGLTEASMSTMPASVQRGFLRDAIQNTTRAPRPYTGLGSDLGSGMGRTLFAGSWNADVHPVLKAHVRDSDFHCAKHRMSGLWDREGELWKTLRREGVETLLFAGVNTDQCVLGTLVDAYNEGLGCVLVEDCCGTTTVGAREVSVWNISNSYGFVTNSHEILDCKLTHD